MSSSHSAPCASSTAATPSAVTPEAGDLNVCVVAGTLSSAPTKRDLPSGQHLMMFEITTRAAGQPTRSVPVAWLDGPEAACKWPAGSSVVAVGEVSRRFFRAGGATASRTEVVAAKVVRERGRERRRLLASLPAEVLSWAER